jgi:hypothetical protein
VSRVRIATAVLIAAGAALSTAEAVAADSFTPITMTAKVSSIARRHGRLPIRVAVAADPGVLDTSDEPLRVQVKLAGECGASFQTTTGTMLLNAPLKPPVQTGRAYSGGASGSGRPASFGTQTLCVYLEDPSADRVYANDESGQVAVTARCTTAAARYDSAHRALLRAQRQLRRARTAPARRRARRLVAKRKRAQARARRGGVAACGKTLPL